MNQENHGVPQCRSKSPCAAKSWCCSWPASLRPASAAPLGLRCCGLVPLSDDEEDEVVVVPPTRAGDTTAEPRLVAAQTARSCPCPREVACNVACHEGDAAATSVYDIIFFCFYLCFQCVVELELVSWGEWMWALLPTTRPL